MSDLRLSPSRFAFPELLASLEAAGEATRLRILALLAEAELTVTEMMAILGQSQPRVSRHLKLLVEAQLIERHREGAWAFFRFADHPIAETLRQSIVSELDRSDMTLAADRRRLEAVRVERKDQAAAYFSQHAADWNRIRSLHVAETLVEAAVVDLVGSAQVQSILDVGTGTGRMLQVLAPLAARAVGLDVSPAMLAVARSNLDEVGLRHVQLRQGDAYAIPPDLSRFDLVIVHQVLHYLDDPQRAVREAARALRPGGRLLVVDFAPHAEEALREHHAHRRLGFSASEVESFMTESSLVVEAMSTVSPASGEKATLEVLIWVGRDTRLQGDFPAQGDAVLSNFSREVA